MEATLRAIKKVSEIKTKRADMFFKMRMRAHEGMQREMIRADIRKGIELLVPAAANKEKAIEASLRKVATKHGVVSAAKISN